MEESGRTFDARVEVPLRPLRNALLRAVSLVLAFVSVGANVAAAKPEWGLLHRSVRVTSAVEDEIGTAGAQSGKVTVSAVDPTGYRDGLLIYLRRGRCFKTYQAANAYVTNDGYSNQVTSGPPVPLRGSMTYGFSTQGDYYSTVCAMIYYSAGGQNPSGAPIGTTQPYVSYTYATGEAAIKHGPPIAVTTSATPNASTRTRSMTGSRPQV